MARKSCSICSSPFRRFIDDALRRGNTIMSVAKRFNFAKSSVHRHRKAGHHKNVSPADKHSKVFVDWSHDSCPPSDVSKEKPDCGPNDVVFVVEREAAQPARDMEALQATTQPDPKAE
jgi:hypothetical protein